MSESAPSLAAATVLVVDDEKTIRLLIEQTLESVCNKVVTAASDEEAREQIRHLPSIDIALVDKNLAGASGLDLIHVIKDRWHDVEVIMITGFPSAESAAEAAARGAGDFLKKPFTIEELEARVAAAFEKVRLRREHQALRDKLQPGAPQAAALSFDMQATARPDWENVERLRIALLNCFAAAITDPARCEALAMAASELMENAVKYGAWAPRGDAVFRVEVSGDSSGARVAVSNPVSADGGAGDVLATLAFMQRFGTPLEAFQARMMEIARPGSFGGGRLGLLRIAYEGDLTLSASTENDTLIVEARSRDWRADGGAD